jgi:indolepyruvate ferredoxin oxidoreductase beta subunit
MDAMVAADRPICIAITAMGGQGGGVLADWIVATAEAQGWVAQSTSVPGVAQRTGATIYYVEVIRATAGRAPVLALMPVPGDVDVVIAAELMEAGRAIQRGLVSPDKTVLIASTHRSLSMLEKINPGDGVFDPGPVLAAAEGVSARFLSADMQALAEKNGSVISAALFGALAASGALPFPRAAFEDAIRAAGVGVGGSLAAFSAGFAAVSAPESVPAAPAGKPVSVTGPAAERASFAEALKRIDAMPREARDMLLAGMQRVADYQDGAYAHEYLDRVAAIAAMDNAASGYLLTIEAARWIAVAMAYDDPIRVADLKTRASRSARVRGEVLAKDDQLVATTEFMHPRVAELCATMPEKWGHYVEGSAFWQRVLRIVFERPRRVRTTTLFGFFQLWAVASLKPRRRTLLRHKREMAHIAAWLGTVQAHATGDYRLAVELLICRRLVKGYSDTHARGEAKFDRVIGALPLLTGRADAADWIRRLREAALADADGKMLEGALTTVRSF